MRKRRDNSFRRGSARLRQYKVALLACQGKVTEPNYFRALLQHLRIPNAEFLQSVAGLDSLQVVRKAIQKYESDPSAYDHVFCVFDRDSDAQYSAAVNLATSHKLALTKSLRHIASTPCFEIWILLHFAFTTKPFVKAGGKSPCDNVQVELTKKENLPKYDKTNPRTLGDIFKRLDTALSNAAQLRKHKLKAQTTNPSTDVDFLVKHLRDIAPAR